MKKIGIIGAGFIGQAVARQLLKAGYAVMISNSRGKESLQEISRQLPGVQTGSRNEAIAFGNIVLVAIPFFRYPTLPADRLAGKIVLDANNYYPDRDGRFPALDKHETTTSSLIAQHLKDSNVVKIFNAILAEDIVTDAKPHGAAGRRALPIAADDDQAKAVAARLLDDVGFDYVDAGTLAQSWRFERAKPAYCFPLDIPQLTAALAQAQRDKELPHNAWHQKKGE